jgi:hypothetical protein
LPRILTVGFVDQPGRIQRFPVPADLLGQGRPELLDPAQDRATTHVDASIRQDASDTFGRGTQLQVVPNGEQDDLTWEAMT